MNFEILSKLPNLVFISKFSSSNKPKGIEFECLYCSAYVGDNTKHWRDCNRWVKDFDHHWKWLNNCIGHNNYKYFFTVVALTSLSGYFILGLTISALVEVEKLPYRDLKLLLEIFIYFFLTAKILVTGLLTTLLVFHIYLWKQGITTFEILKKDKIAAEKEKSKKKQISESDDSEIRRNRIISDQSALPLKIIEADNISKSFERRESQEMPHEYLDGYHTTKKTGIEFWNF